MKKKIYTTGALLAASAVVYATVQSAYDGWNSNGDNTIMSGGGMAVGNGNTSQQDSITSGVSNHAEGNSISVGTANYTDDKAIAVGVGNIVTNGGAAFGTNNDISASGSFAIGVGNESYIDDGDGRGNLMLGRYNIAGPGNNDYAENNVLIGESNFSVQNDAWTFGKGNIGQATTLTVGTYAEQVSNASFIVGNGTGTAQRSNGLVVMKNGDVIIPKAQGDISMGAYQ